MAGMLDWHARPGVAGSDILKKLGTCYTDQNNPSMHSVSQ